MSNHLRAHRLKQGLSLSGSYPSRYPENALSALPRNSFPKTVSIHPSAIEGLTRWPLLKKEGSRSPTFRMITRDVKKPGWCSSVKHRCHPDLRRSPQRVRITIFS